jgi:hypothetical protein
MVTHGCFTSRMMLSMVDEQMKQRQRDALNFHDSACFGTQLLHEHSAKWYLRSDEQAVLVIARYHSLVPSCWYDEHLIAEDKMQHAGWDNAAHHPSKSKLPACREKPFFGAEPQRSCWKRPC